MGQLKSAAWVEIASALTILFNKEDIDAAIAGNQGFKTILKAKLRKAAEEGLVYYQRQFKRHRPCWIRAGIVLVELYTGNVYTTQ